MAVHKIISYPGDGIGIDVTREAIRSLNAAAKVCGVEVQIEEVTWGERYWKEKRSVAPDNFLEILRQCDAVYLGALGDPKNVPDHISLKPLIDMRQGFEQYACLRPARLFDGISTPLANKEPGDIDIMIVRENSEGEYIDAGGMFKAARTEGMSLQVAVHTRKGIERVLRYGFELARKRRGRLTMATKSNALKYGMVLWDQVLEDICVEYGDVEAEKCHVDALAMNFVRCPEHYDVVVASNLFGDILSDIGGTIAGGLGLAPSANLNPELEYPSLFEPVHGSAPDIAGKGIANPIAAIVSAGMMLDFLGEADAAGLVEKAVRENLADGSVRTPDLGGKATTEDVGIDIADRVKNSG